MDSSLEQRTNIEKNYDMILTRIMNTNISKDSKFLFYLYFYLKCDPYYEGIFYTVCIS